MSRALRVAAAVLVLAITSGALALDVPPKPATWFTDAANVVNSSDAEALNNKLRAFEQQSGIRFIVYVFPTLGDEAPEDFTIRCAEQWTVWRAKEDRGLILAVFVQERKVRIDTSYPLEPDITDAFSSQVIRNDIAPRFKEQDYAGGLNAGIDAIAKKLGVQVSGAPAPQPRVTRVRERESEGFNWLSLLAVLFFVFVLPMISRRRGGGCFWPLFFLGGGGPGITFGGGRRGGWGGGGGGGGFGGGGFGGGGSFGGGGATGGW